MMYAFTRKVSSWWLRVGFPPLNLDSFFDFKLKVVEAWSRMLKYSSEQTVRHCGELCRCLKIWQVLSLTKCSRRRVDKYLEVDETPRHLFTRVCVSTWSVITRRRNLDIYPHAYVSTWSVIACRRNLDIYPHAYVSTWSVIGPLTFSDIYTILHSVALFVKNCRNMFFSFKSVVRFLKFEIQFLIRKYNTLTVLHQNKENPFSPLFETQINSFFLRFWPFHVFLSFIFFLTKNLTSAGNSTLYSYIQTYFPTLFKH